MRQEAKRTTECVEKKNLARAREGEWRRALRGEKKKKKLEGLFPSRTFRLGFTIPSGKRKGGTGGNGGLLTRESLYILLFEGIEGAVFHCCRGTGKGKKPNLIGYIANHNMRRDSIVQEQASDRRGGEIELLSRGFESKRVHQA